MISPSSLGSGTAWQVLKKPWRPATMMDGVVEVLRAGHVRIITSITQVCGPHRNHSFGHPGVIQESSIPRKTSKNHLKSISVLATPDF